ncbi:hypothetical protein J2795_003423 [Chryseobacterium bernardetii]|uniref:Lipoprotein n=2 Tax=Chryseobacterium TaxID=59732 RepID=A0A543ECK2_9FLAO|nr:MULTISPECIES: hypothetical protein [Chryseobacterium]MDR6372478.1 hypothetical protein [Chryseobacterium vietnamense]MDR6442696.1 hypothetical protein [Chryseobacterium bernardetii]TQM19328.1 hypothetical protein FB551_3727 [Chryseobacterium aquifrigidense]
MKITRTVFLLLMAIVGLTSCSEEHLSEEELKTARENIEKHYKNPTSMYSWGNISPWKEHWNNTSYPKVFSPPQIGKSIIGEEKQNLEYRFSGKDR